MKWRGAVGPVGFDVDQFTTEGCFVEVAPRSRLGLVMQISRAGAWGLLFRFHRRVCNPVRGGIRSVLRPALVLGVSDPERVLGC